MKIRVLLLIIICLLAFGGFEAYEVLSRGQRPVGLRVGFPSVFVFMIAVSGIPAASAMLIGSFFKMTSVNGHVTYDPNNPYIRIMRRILHSDWRGPIYLCAAFWQTTFVVFNIEVVLIAIYAGVRVIGELSTLSFTFSTPPTLFYVLMGLTVVMAGGISFMAANTSRTKNKVGHGLFGGSLAIIICWAYTAAAISENTTIIAFLWIHFQYLIFASAGIGATVSILKFAIKKCRALRNTALGQLAIGLMEDLCPIAYPGESS